MSIKTETGDTVPCDLDRPTRPGLYLSIFHGRESIEQQMDDWGSPGPLFGPLEFCHTTYANLIRIQFESASDEARLFCNVEFPDPQHLLLDHDLLLYNGVYYGDWSLFVLRPDECELPCDTFRPVARRELAPSRSRFAIERPVSPQGAAAPEPRR